VLTILLAAASRLDVSGSFYVAFLIFSAVICLALWWTSSNILATSFWEGAWAALDSKLFSFRVPLGVLSF